jgi:hypothetical protein
MPGCVPGEVERRRVDVGRGAHLLERDPFAGVAGEPGSDLVGDGPIVFVHAVTVPGRVVTGPVVMVTGHRVLPRPDTVPAQLERVLAKLDPSMAVSGGAAGADLMFAEAALRVGVPLHLVLPNRSYRWRYPGVVSDEILAGAAEVTYVVDRPEIDDWRERRQAWDKGKWWRDNFVRNRAMVTASDTTVVVSDHHPHWLLGHMRSGTAGTVRHVLRERGEGHRVLWVAPATEPARWVPLRVEHALGDWSDFAQ